jgi:hypothetical protein
MARIERPAACIDVGRPSALVEIALMPVVARCAEALQIAMEELVPIAFVRDDMVGDRCDSRNTTFEAHLADWMIAQLSATATTPAFELIPATPIRRNERWWRRHCFS